MNMGKWLLRLTACTIVSLSWTLVGQAESPVSVGSAEPLMRVYFIKFDVYTYVGISMASIHEVSNYALWFLKQDPAARQGEHPFVSKLRRELQSRPLRGGRINDEMIRLRVDIGPQTFFVDMQGTVLEKTSGKTFRLTRAQRQAIEQEIIHLSGVVDLRAIRGLKLPTGAAP